MTLLDLLMFGFVDVCGYIEIVGEIDEFLNL